MAQGPCEDYVSCIRIFTPVLTFQMPRCMVKNAPLFKWHCPVSRVVEFNLFALRRALNLCQFA